MEGSRDPSDFMTPETIDAIVESHDELVRVCQAMMSLILKKNLFEDLAEYFVDADVTPGFAERAEEARTNVMNERIRLC